jgi:quinol monooxygenase YgiN
LSQRDPITELREAVTRMLNRLDQDAPISATVVFQVDGAKEGDFARNLEALSNATRRLSGANVFAYGERQPTDPPAHGGSGPVEYVIYEDWETVEQFRKQWDSEHLQKFQAGVGGFLVAPPDLRFYRGWSDAGTRAEVPRTGQTRCYGTGGEIIDCADTGQDGDIRAGAAWPEPRFRDNRDGTVTDRLTRLTWLKDADRFGEVTWDEALANAKSLAGGSHGLTDNSKAGDWRLPNIKELFSLIDYGAGDPIIPHDNPFTNVRSSIYWTSTTLVAAPTLAWMMTLGIGPTVFDLKINPNRMWPVRGKNSRVPKTGQRVCFNTRGDMIECAGTGQDGDVRAGAAWPAPRFTDNRDGTVTDNLTGLVWLRKANPFGLRTWQQALDDCNGLRSGQHGLKDGSRAGDWRLPNIREIESLVDYNEAGPCLPRAEELPFEDLRPSSYWTSTSVALAPTEAMFIILGVGPAIFENKEHPFFVWPVRDRRRAR